MNISTVNIVLNANDLLDIIKEYVKIEGLSFKKLEINEFIDVYGSYKKGIEIPFKIRLALGNVKDNLINVKILDVKVAKIGIIKGIKNFIMKKILKEFEKYGIKSYKDTIKVNLKLVSKLVPYVYFKLNSVKIGNGSLEAVVEDLKYDDKKEKVNLDKDKENYDVYKDKYYYFRKSISKKVPDKYKTLVRYASIVPDIFALLCRLFRDKRVDLNIKIKIAAIIGYLAMPFDILPDFIPFVGRIDDVAVAFYGLNSIMNDIPEKIILVNWSGEKDIVKTIKEGVTYISEFVGSKNIGKVVSTLKTLIHNGRNKAEKCV